MRAQFILIAVLVGLGLGGCVHGPPPLAPAPDPAGPYILDSGDRLRVVVFGQDGLSNSYAVDASGRITMPLIGPVPARGMTTAEVSQAIAGKLKDGYVREPHVAVEVEIYRPFFVLGEVTTPGQFPYVPNLTAEGAVAIAGGFSPRALRGPVEVHHQGSDGIIVDSVPLNYPVHPGDTIVVAERWF
ncbi:MAG TPA: polysaccharide biosynthesis/export family protein [Xanthobacteraceae bacterium]|nr:polysaccharide biosynthesis/export family protein [Xanthobacteraceae bacterium]